MPETEPSALQTAIPQLLWRSCDGMMVIDGERRILAMNASLERLLGCRAERVVGRRQCGALLQCKNLHGASMVQHPCDCPGLQALASRKAVPSTEYTVHAAGGHRLVMSASYTPIQLSAKGPAGCLVILRDVTRQKRQERLLERQAMSDPLTGLPNRTCLLTTCRRELLGALRHGRPLALVMLDVDGFKRYNDAYGHLAGDRLLKTLADILQTDRRGEELVARFGGDEFVLLLPETDATGAMVAADRVRRIVAEFPFPAPDGAEATHHPITLSLSGGLVVCPSDGRTVEALLSAADQRLYRAKQQGGNCIVGSQPRQERRRQWRVPIRAGVALRRVSDLEEPACEGRTRDLSLCGAYCIVPTWHPVALGDRVAMAIDISGTPQTLFPLSRIEGYGVVTRVEDAVGHEGRPLAGHRGIGLRFEESMKLVAAFHHV